MKFLRIFPLFALPLLFASCEKDANIDLPEVKPKLVVIGFISPQDTLITVTVTRSRPVFEQYDVNTSAAVPDANVTLSNGSSTIQLTYDPQHEWYWVHASQFPITAGTTYTLTAGTAADGIATAATTVPYFSNPNYNVTFTSTLRDTNSYGFTREYFFENTWQDQPGSPSFYRLATIAVSERSVQLDTLFALQTSTLADDRNNEGGVIEKDSYGYKTAYHLQYYDSLVAFDLHLMHVTPEYYLYHQSLPLASYNDPFSEPRLVYSNVTGGLGIFAGYNSVKRRIWP